MFKGGEHLFVNIFLDKEFVNDHLDVIVLIWIEFNFFADVVFNAVNLDVSTPFRPDVVEEIVIIFAVDFEDRGVNFNFGAFWH